MAKYIFKGKSIIGTGNLCNFFSLIGRLIRIFNCFRTVKFNQKRKVWNI